MNIKKLLRMNDDLNKSLYASSFKRGLAITIDIWIVFFLRAAFIQISGMSFMNSALIDFNEKFKEKFSTDTIKNTPEHIDFIIHHPIFYYSIFVYAFLILIGLFYHAYLNSSAWQGTVGKRLTKIMIVRSDNSSIHFWRGVAHYILSVAPFIFIIYLISYQFSHKVTLFQAITATEINLFLSLSFAIWMQVHLFTRKRNTVYDMICDTLLVNGKTDAKTPWQKTMISSTTTQH